MLKKIFLGVLLLVAIYSLLSVAIYFSGGIFYEKWGNCEPNYPFKRFGGAYLTDNLGAQEYLIYKKYVEEKKCLDGSQPEEIFIYEYDDPQMLDEEYWEYVYYCRNDNQYLVVGTNNGWGFRAALFQGIPCKVRM